MDYTSTFTVGRYECQLKFSPKDSGFTARWEPTIPKGLTPAELAQYRAGRDALIKAFTQCSGLTVAVVEV